MPDPRDPIAEALRQLEAMPRDVTQWEALFLESVRHQYPARPLSPKQQQVLWGLVDKYLPQLAAEHAGQQRLF